MRRTTTLEPLSRTTSASWTVDVDGAQWYRMVDPTPGIARIETTFGITLPASAARVYFGRAHSGAATPVAWFIGKCMGDERLAQYVDALAALAFLERFREGSEHFEMTPYETTGDNVVADVYRECQSKCTTMPPVRCTMGVLAKVVMPDVYRSDGILVMRVDDADRAAEPVAHIDADALKRVKQEVATERITTIVCRHLQDGSMPLPLKDVETLDEMCSEKERKTAARWVARGALAAGATRQQADRMIERILE